MDTIVAILIAARWAHFVSLFLLFGSAIFWVHMGRAASLPATRARIGRLMPAVSVIVAVSGLAWLAGSIATMTGDVSGLADPEMLHAFFLETRFGPLALARLALFLVIVALAFGRIGDRHRMPILSLPSGLLLVSQAWLGHAAEDEGTLYGASMIVSYAIHVLAAAAWLGGLVPLAFGVVEEGRCKAPTEEILRLLMRFSSMAFVAVAAVVLSGMANSAFRIGVPTSAEVSSAYGTILLVKISLVIGMLLFAAMNRFILMPRLDRNPERRLLQAATAGIVAEFALGLLVLGAAALLGITPPPR